jgi:hypothetical protein
MQTLDTWESSRISDLSPDRCSTHTEALEHHAPQIDRALASA